MSKESHMLYNDRLNAIVEKLKVIDGLLERHSFEAFVESFPYTYSGDLSYVLELLENVEKFLNNGG